MRDTEKVIPMSRQAIEDFRQQINEKSDLQDQVRNLDIAGLITLASENGYDLDKAELEAYLAKMGADKSELTDFELELVAGGYNPGMTTKNIQYCSG